MSTATAKAAPAAEISTDAHPSLKEVDRPANLTPANTPGWGSDVIAESLRDLDIPYIALNPGASYRGIHDSIVNYLGNEKPQMILCLHEEVAVAIAHGYAKVTGKAMAAAVHSNVGLFHATMAVFNAWCDRMPMVIVGATGPVDAHKRRPWIDWIHTARDQGAIVRDYTKWDDQPASPQASREAIYRGAWIANTTPQGPVYINFDAELQEAKLDRGDQAGRSRPLHAADRYRAVGRTRSRRPPRSSRVRRTSSSCAAGPRATSTPGTSAWRSPKGSTPRSSPSSRSARRSRPTIRTWRRSPPAARSRRTRRRR